MKFDVFRIKALPKLLLLLVTMGLGCKKFVTIPPPPTSLNGENVYLADNTAASVMTMLYGDLANGGYSVSQSYSYLDGFFVTAGLSADELTLYNLSDGNLLVFYTNALYPQGAIGPWNDIYNQLFQVNSVIQGVTGNTSLTPAVAQQLLGEAKFMRGFYYFYLVNMYGKVPLVTNTDVKSNAIDPNASVDSIYAQITTDLIDAEGLLSDNFLSADLQTVTTEKVRPTKWAAAALLARVYLYKQDYANAYQQAASVIGSGLFTLDSLNGVFLMNSTEAIWQLQSIYEGQNGNTPEGTVFVLPASGPAQSTYEVYLDSAFANSFEAGDNRRVKWIDSVVVGGRVYYYPYKYKIGLEEINVQSEYQMVLRSGEQFLIRAEAEANGAGGGLSSAVGDLNTIRERAGLPDYGGPITRDALMSALLKERKAELFTEWGHRWLDLKRWPVSSTLSNVMVPAATAKGAIWNADNHQALFPISQGELNLDPNLVQNPGY